MIPFRPIGGIAALVLALSLAVWPATAPAQDRVATEMGETAEAVADLLTPAPDSATGEEATPAPADPVPEVEAAAEIDYAAWEKVAQRAEQAIESGRASDQALQTLRAELASWREVFSKAQASDSVRINTLKTQIATLGPAPTDGATEPAILTESRETLTAQLDELQAPVKSAELAYSRANSLISELDTLVRTRKAEVLLSLGPSPLNPANWPGALGELTSTFSLAWTGMRQALQSDIQRADFARQMPSVLIFLVLALLLVLRAPRWLAAVGAKARPGAAGPLRGVLGFLVSLGQLVAPIAGVFALVAAINQTGFVSLRAQVLVDALPAVGVFFFTARWLGGRVFGVPGRVPGVMNLSDATRAEGRYETTMLGLLLGISVTLNMLGDYESYSDATMAVLRFPILAFAGFLLLRQGQLIRRHARSEQGDEDESTGFAARVFALGGTALMVVGVLGPLAAAIGYGTLSGRVVFSSILSLGLAGLLMVLHRFNINLYGALTRHDEAQARESLWPILASTVVALLFVPLMALVWGMQLTDLTEIWTRVKQGVPVGGTVLTPGDLLTFLFVLGLGYGATRLVQGMLKTTILPKTKMDVGGRHAVTSGIGYLGLFLAVIAAVTAAGIDLSSLAIVAGALSVGIGFGLQNIVSNFVSGIILLIERPISEGDWIEVGGQMGYVRDISVRSTRIETFDRTDVILPNSDLVSGVVTNYTRGNLIGRVIIKVGVAYGTDTRKVETILKEIAQDHPIVAVNPPPNVLFMGFGADSLDFEIRAILKDVNYVLAVKSDINHAIARRFAEEGIEIPFAQRDIWLRNPEALTGAMPKGPVASDVTPAPAAPTTDPSARHALSAEDMPDGSGEADD